MDVVHPIDDEGLIGASVVLAVDDRPVELGLRQLDMAAAQAAEPVLQHLGALYHALASLGDARLHQEVPHLLDVVVEVLVYMLVNLLKMIHHK